VFGVFLLKGAFMGDPNSPTVTPIQLGAFGAIPVAFLVWGIGLSLGGPTGYAINPAHDLGPRIMHAILPIAGKGGSDWGYSWIPVVGPVIGGILGAVVWMILSASFRGFWSRHR
jgi:glycerol uptake facilitator